MDQLIKEYSQIVYNNQHGRYGIISYGVRNHDNLDVVIKQVEKSRHLVYFTDGTTPMEVGMLEYLKEIDGVCQMIEWFESDDEYVVVMKRAHDYIDLFDFIGVHGDKLPEDMALTILNNLLTIVLDIDGKNVVHRDLKPDNILIHKESLKLILIDFDSATFKRPHDEPFKCFNGTRHYYPPEYYITHTYRAEPMTVWSLGVILYEMITGYAPFQNKIQIVNTCLDYKNVSERIEQILRCTLMKDSEQRYTFEELRSELTCKS